MKKIDEHILTWELAAEGFSTIDDVRGNFDILDYISPYDFYPNQLDRFPSLDPMFDGDEYEDWDTWHTEPASEFNSDDLFDYSWHDDSYEYFYSEDC